LLFSAFHKAAGGLLRTACFWRS